MDRYDVNISNLKYCYQKKIKELEAQLKVALDRVFELEQVYLNIKNKNGIKLVIDDEVFIITKEEQDK